MALTVYHLDDHYLYASGLEKALEDSWPNIDYTHFTDPKMMLQAISSAYKEGTTIDCIITDLNHPGINGYDLGRGIRRLQKDAKIRTPILLLSMVGKGHSLVQQGLEEGVFDFCLPKSADAIEIEKTLKKAISLT